MKNQELLSLGTFKALAVVSVEEAEKMGEYITGQEGMDHLNTIQNLLYLLKEQIEKAERIITLVQQ